MAIPSQNPWISFSACKLGLAKSVNFHKACAKQPWKLSKHCSLWHRLQHLDVAWASNISWQSALGFYQSRNGLQEHHGNIDWSTLIKWFQEYKGDLHTGALSQCLSILQKGQQPAISLPDYYRLANLGVLASWPQYWQCKSFCWLSCFGRSLKTAVTEAEQQCRKRRFDGGGKERLIKSQKRWPGRIVAGAESWYFRLKG